VDGAYRCMLYFCSESCRREYFMTKKSLIALIKALRNFAAGGVYEEEKKYGQG
jgi:hypothetical protein